MVSNAGDMLMGPAVRDVCDILQKYDDLKRHIINTEEIIKRDYPDEDTLGHQMFQRDLQDYNDQADHTLKHLHLAFSGLSDAGRDSFIYVRRELLQRYDIQFAAV